MVAPERLSFTVSLYELVEPFCESKAAHPTGTALFNGVVSERLLRWMPCLGLF